MRTYLFGIPVDDYSLDEILYKVSAGERLMNIFINIHKINIFYKNPSLRPIISDAHCIFSVDGQWIKWMLRFKGFLPKDRFGGMEVMKGFLKAAEEKNWRVYLWGGTKDTINKIILRIKNEFPHVPLAGWMDGFSAFKDAIEEIKQANVDILFVALPSPLKELMGYKVFKDTQNVRYVAGVGGAFDVLAGKFSRAPRHLQKAGMEWLYRCMQDPFRLGRRYLKDACYFLSVPIRKNFKM